MRGVLANKFYDWYSSPTYECNIDLSKPHQVQGVTNLAHVPIEGYHGEYHTGRPSALHSVTSSVTGEQVGVGQYAINKRHITDKLDLGLI